MGRFAGTGGGCRRTEGLEAELEELEGMGRGGTVGTVGTVGAAGTGAVETLGETDRSGEDIYDDDRDATNSPRDQSALFTPYIPSPSQSRPPNHP